VAWEEVDLNDGMWFGDIQVSDLEDQGRYGAYRFDCAFQIGEPDLKRFTNFQGYTLTSVAVVEGSVATSFDEGATFVTIPEPKGPISMALIHGLLDPVALYDGGMGSSQYYYAPVADAVSLWTAADGCTDTPADQTSADGNFLTRDYTACTSGYEVELFTVINGKHEWPTLEGTAEFSATDAILDFFFRHSH